MLLFVILLNVLRKQLSEAYPTFCCKESGKVVMSMLSGKRKRSLSRGSRTYTSEIKRYALLLLLPLVLGIALLFCIHQITSAQIEQRGNATAKHLSANASSILREMQIVSDSLLDDGQFMQEITAEQISDPVALCEIIRTHLHKSPYVSSAYVISEQHQRIYSGNGHYLYDGITAVLSSIILADQSSGETYNGPLLDLEPGWHILNANYAPPYYVTSITGEKGEMTTLLVTLNMREFLRSLYATDADMCCIFSDDFSVSTLLQNHLGLNWRSPEEVSRVLGTQVRCFYVEADEFTYLTAISVKSYNAPLKTVLYVFCVYFALVFVFGLFYLVQVSKRRYRMVAEMVDGLPHGLSANPTYEDILSAVRTSLNAYRDKYNEDRERSISLHLQHILTGNHSKEVTAQQFSAAGINPKCRGYYICLLHINDSEVLVTSGSSALNVDATCLIFKSAFTRFSEEKLGVTAAYIEQNYYAVFSVEAEDVDNEFVRGVIGSTTKLIAEEYGLKVRAAASEFIRNAEQLSQAFAETKGLYQFSSAIGSFANVVLQDDIESKMSIILNGSYLKQIEILSRTLLMEKYDIIPSMVEVILDEHVSGLGKHYSLASDRLTSVANLLAEAVMASGITSEEAKEYARSLRKADSILVLNALSREVFTFLAQHPRHSENDSIVDKACAYINDNLSNPNLSVPEISQAVNVSVQHLSRLFRQKLSTTILEHINTCRIELAKKTLVTSNCTMSQIAEIAGYNNTVTLSRNFKRYVGLTPSEYRELNK